MSTTPYIFPAAKSNPKKKMEYEAPPMMQKNPGTPMAKPTPPVSREPMGGNVTKTRGFQFSRLDEIEANGPGRAAAPPAIGGEAAQPEMGQEAAFESAYPGVQWKISGKDNKAGVVAASGGAGVRGKTMDELRVKMEKNKPFSKLDEIEANGPGRESVAARKAAMGDGLRSMPNLGAPKESMAAAQPEGASSGSMFPASRPGPLAAKPEEKKKPRLI